MKGKKLYLDKGTPLFFPWGGKPVYLSRRPKTIEHNGKKIIVNKNNKDLIYEILKKELHKKREELIEEIKWKLESHYPENDTPGTIEIKVPRKDKFLYSRGHHTTQIATVSINYLKHHIFLHSLGVNHINYLSSLKNLGIASLLIKKVIQIAKEQRKKVVILDCNNNLIEFYKKQGFKILEKRESQNIMGMVLNPEWKEEFKTDYLRFIRKLKSMHII
jgi:hypothetical protein